MGFMKPEQPAAAPSNPMNQQDMLMRPASQPVGTKPAKKPQTPSFIGETAKPTAGQGWSGKTLVGQ